MDSFVFNKYAFRPGQLAAFNVATERLKSEEPTTSIVLPTRYGKSDTQRLVSLQVAMDSVVCGTLHLTSGLYLVRQFSSDSEVLQMAARYEVPPSSALNIRQANPEDGWFENGEYCVSMTVQMATRNARLIMQNAAQWAEATGLPLHLCMDECDEAVYGKARGHLVKEWLDSGFMVSMWTALAVREDGERVPGFKYETVSSEEDVRYDSRLEVQPGGELKRRVDTIAGSRVSVRITSDHETTFQEAWDESPSPLCDLNRLTIDCEVEDDEGVSLGMLSTLKESVARKVLGRAVRSDFVIESGVRLMLEDMRQNRAADEQCTSIVFTGDDSEKWSNEENFHAEMVRKKVHDLSKECGYKKKLRVAVATNKNEEKISSVIEDFVKRESGIDILIVKQAAGRGLTAPHLKTLLDLSTIRTARAFVQRSMRVATPFDNIRTATVILPSDPMSVRLWETYIKSQGGEHRHDEMSQFIDDEVIATRLKDVEDPPTRSDLDVSSASLSHFDDNLGFYGAASQYPLVAKIVMALPEVKSRRTLPQIAKALIAEGIDIAESHVLRSSGEGIGIGTEIEGLRAEVNRKLTSLCSITYAEAKRLGDDGIGKWRTEIASIYDAAWKSIGFPFKKLNTVSNIQTLKALIRYAEGRTNAKEADVK